MASEKQVRANQQNALKSTGPRTPEGKTVVSNNRMTHGILSSKLLLPNENEDEYQALLADLRNDLRPVGTLELTLVERIAVSLWRQRRLIRAETAKVSLDMSRQAIADTIGAGLGIGKYSVNALKADDLDPPSQEMIAWCRAVIVETADSNIQDLNQLQSKAPLLFAQLSEDAECEDLTPAEYLNGVASLDQYVRDFAEWCRSELAKSERFEQVTGLIPTAIDKLSCPLANSDLLSKYQTTLDNQTYKAIKTLREAQDWRLKTIEAAPTIDRSNTA